MAAERRYLQETIANLKLALETPDDASESDDTIVGPSNRGRKLKRKARYVHEGRLDDGRGVDGFKEEVEYYGRKKKIIYRKPGRRKRVAVGSDDEGSPNSSGAEGSGSESSDPYEGLDIAKLLAPLESAADLPSHPSMAHIYTNRTLNELIQQSLDKICEEQAHTVKLKNLLTKFLGDDPWINLEKMQWPNEDHEAVARERSDILLRQLTDIQTANGRAHAGRRASGDGEINGKMTNGTPKAAGEDCGGEDVEVVEGVNGHVEPLTTDAATGGGNTPLSSASASATLTDGVPPSTTRDTIMADEEPPKEPKTEDPNSHDEGMQTREATLQPEEPRRMTTRSTHNNAFPVIPEAPSVEVDAFFFPPNYQIDRDHGLPAAEAADTRRLLITAVQRQDEFLRGLKKVQHGLLRAESMRKKVWDWCRTMEGMREYHQRRAAVSGDPRIANYDIDEGEGVGLSDGEDWYDMDAWGLEEPLEKGREEEEEGDEVVRGKKTRRRDR